MRKYFTAFFLLILCGYANAATIEFGNDSSSNGFSQQTLASTNTFTATQNFPRIGVGTAVNSGTYRVEVYGDDSNLALFRNLAAGAGSVSLLAQADASYVLDGGRDGAGTQVSCYKILTNGNEAGHLCSDAADGNKLKLDYGSSAASITGLVITSAHNVGIGTSAPAVKVDVAGSVRVSSGVAVTPTSAQTVNTTMSQIFINGGLQLISSTGPITLQSAPTISTVSMPDGFKFTLVSTAANITLRNQSALTGSGLQLKADTVVISTFNAVDFQLIGQTVYQLSN